MPVYHFTVHAYRSWGPSKPRGYTQRRKGYLRPDPKMQEDYDNRAKQEPASFDDRDIQEILILGTYDICRRRGWRLHGVGTDEKHYHWVVSWRGFIPWQEVRKITKNILSLLLNRVTGQEGRRWFVRDGSRKRVENDEHLNYLKKKYLPDHRGLHWVEGNSLPEDRYGILAS